MKIFLVCVCYNAHEDLVLFLESVEESYRFAKDVNDSFELEVVVSDNSSTEFNLDPELYGFSVAYIKNENIGYFPAVTRAMQSFDSTVHEDSDYFIISNVDLTIDRSFILELINKKLPINVGALAPSILSCNDGRDLNPKILSRPSVKKIKILRTIFLSDFLFSFYEQIRKVRECIRSQRYTLTSCQNNDSIFAPHGSFIILTSSYFRSGGDVNYPRFLFGEETFLGEMLLANNQICIYTPSLVIHDREHGSTSKAPSKLMRSHHVQSYDYYLSRFRS